MLLLYTLLLLLFGVAGFLIVRRVASLERKYSKVARQTDKLVRESPFREGNSTRLDPFLVAKRQYQLGLLAQKRDTPGRKAHVLAAFRQEVRQLRRWRAQLEGQEAALHLWRFGCDAGAHLDRLFRPGRVQQSPVPVPARYFVDFHLVEAYPKKGSDPLKSRGQTPFSDRVSRSGTKPGRRAAGGRSVSAPAFLIPRSHAERGNEITVIFP